MPKEKKPGIIERNKGKLGSAAFTGAMYGGDALELLKFFFKNFSYIYFLYNQICLLFFVSKSIQKKDL